MKLLSIFTPTYNRGYIIEKLYKSLLEQNTDVEFEWIIIDDGSTDDTEQKVKLWKKNHNNFDIIYKKQINRGKHIAINEGVKLATGKLFFIVDSDDHLADNAINKIAYWESKFTKEEKEKFVGISGNRGYNEKKIVGKTFKGKYLDATTIERRKYNILGDKAEVFYTEVLRKYEFPQIENERFLSEAYIWNKIALDGYKIRWINEIFIICNYLQDGLTAKSYKIARENPKGTLLYLKQLIEIEKKTIRKLAHYVSYCNIASEIYTKEEIIKQLNISNLKYNMFIIIGNVRKVINDKSKKNNKIFKNEN
ncbi:MAG: glycosyltransferase family 2 protein [Clostridia bacterium]